MSDGHGGTRADERACDSGSWYELHQHMKEICLSVTSYLSFCSLLIFVSILLPSIRLVPVGGDVKVEVECLYRADSKLAGARLSCHISRGTFPYISWLLNDSVLPFETHADSHIQPVPSYHALTDHRRTLILAKLGPEESGYYRCRARDSYDDSGPWVESAAVLVRATGEKD